MAKRSSQTSRRVPLKSLLAQAGLGDTARITLQEVYDKLYWGTRPRPAAISLEVLIGAAGLDEQTAQALRLAAKASAQST